VWLPGSADMVCPRRPLMTQVQHWAKMAQTDHVTLELWPWRSWRLWLVWVVVFHLHTKFEVRRPCRSECMWALMGPVTLTFSFDLETSMRVASKVGNLSSKFGHARPLGSRIISLCTRQTDRRKDKSNAYCPPLLLTVGASVVFDCFLFCLILYNVFDMIVSP